MTRPLGAWQDLGVVFRVAKQRPWMASHGYVPTALALDGRIRVYAAFLDADRIGRVGSVDVAADDPARVLGFSDTPVLDVGRPGCFDEHGVTPMSVCRTGDEIRLYYAGWQRSPSVRYHLFTGLAVSRDGGGTFRRVVDVPVIDRSPGHHLVRTGFIAPDESGWRAWLAQSDGLIDVDGKPTPRYVLSHLRSADGIAWPADGTACFGTLDETVFGIGRSAVWQDGALYHGLFSLRRRAGYRIEHAVSADGIAWSPCRTDGLALLPDRTSPAQQQTMFPSVIGFGSKMYAFYNGDRFGEEGIRCAIWHGAPWHGAVPPGAGA